MKNCAIVILSRGRWDTITTHKLIPDATLIITDQEEQKYSHIDIQKKIIPAKIKGISAVRNWVLENMKEKIIVMFDDDIDKMYILTGTYCDTTKKPEYIKDVIENTAQMAEDLEVGCFGWNQSWDTRKYDPFKPFKFNKWIGTAIGVIGKEIKWDNALMFKCDIDFCLQQMWKKRILWNDTRYAFSCKRDKNKGGNSLFRTHEKIQSEIEYLKNKWGKWLSAGKYRTQYKMSVKVER